MYIIVTCKYEMNPIKNVRENVMTPFFPNVSLSVAMGNTGRIWPNFELIQALMHVLITCKYEKDPIIASGENVMTLSLSGNTLRVSYHLCIRHTLGTVF